MAQRPITKVMLSSTYTELKEHRAAVRAALLSQGMFPVAMEDDAALPKHDLISVSLAKVDEADAYIGLISYRYGQTPVCADRNPDRLSLTELEFRRAVERDIPICMFLMHDDHPVPKSAVVQAAPDADKLAAFQALARQDRICGEFRSVDDLKALVQQSLGRLREALGRRHSPDADPLRPSGDLLPEPPALHAAPPYLPSHEFFGRKMELALIDSWAGSADPMLVFEAIGGMGKSMQTWQWLHENAPKLRADWAGRLWYSFYETGADLNDFCVTALAYVTHLPKAAFRGRRTADLGGELLRTECMSCERSTVPARYNAPMTREVGRCPPRFFDLVSITTSWRCCARCSGTKRALTSRPLTRRSPH